MVFVPEISKKLSAQEPSTYLLTFNRYLLLLISENSCIFYLHLFFRAMIYA